MTLLIYLASVEAYLEQFLSLLTPEEHSIVQYKAMMSLCEALVLFSGPEMIQSLSQKALLKLRSYNGKEDSPIESRLSLLCFLNPQIFHFYTFESKDCIQELLSGIFEGILHSLSYEELQDICLRSLLPPLVEFIVTTQSESIAVGFAEKLSTRLMQLMREEEREVALSGLVQFLDFIQKTNSSFSLDNDLVPNLQSLLTNEDTLIKKRSFFVLERLWLSDNTLWKKAFLSLYSALDEFGLYLVQQDWNKIELLHPTAKVADLPSEIRSWTPLIWSKGLKHKNHQVQRLVLKTFLERAWSNDFLTQISFEFLFQIFIPCLASTHIQKDPNESNHQLNGEEFLKNYVESLTDSMKVEFVMEFLKRVFIADISRGALKSGISCFVAVAQCINPSSLTNTQANLLLMEFQVVISMVSNIHGAGFKLSLYQGILSSLKSLIPLSLASCWSLLSVLASFPVFLSCHGGALNAEIKDWLLKDSTDQGDCLNLAISSMIESAFSTGSLKECKTGSEQFLIVFLQFCPEITSSCLNLINILKQVLARLYTQSYPDKEQEIKVLLFTKALLQASAKAAELVPAEVDRKLVMMMTESLDEIYSYGLMHLEGIASGTEALSKNIELALTCLAMTKQYFDCSDSRHRDMSHAFGQKCTSLVNKIFSWSSEFFKESETNLLKASIRNNLLKCLEVLCPGIDPECNITQHLEVLLSFQDAPTLVKNTSYEDLMHQRWTCIHSLASVCKLKNCTISLKARLIERMLDCWELLDESLLLTMIQLIHPLVKELYINEEFAAMVYSLLSKEDFNEISWSEQIKTVIWNVVRSVWAAFIGRKKTLEICSALTELIYQPEAFHSASLTLLHEDDGPIYWMTMKLMDTGTRSPRVLLLTTIRLIKGLQESLHLVEYYIPYLTNLVLHDARDRGQADFVDSELLQSQLKIMDEDLLYAFQSSIIAPRIAFSCFIHSLSQKTSLNEPSSLSSQSTASNKERVGFRLWKHFIKVAMTDDLQQQTHYRVGSQTHRAKLRLWQTLTLLTQFVTTPDQIKRNLQLLTVILKQGNISSVRMYIRNYIFPFIKHYEKRHEALPGYILIAYQVGMSCEDQDLKRSLLTELVCAVFPWTMSHNHATRAFAQLTLDALIQRFPELKSLLTTDESSNEDVLNPWPSLGRYLTENKDLSRLKRGLGSSMKQLEPSERDVVSLSSIFQLPDEKDANSIVFESAPEPLIEKIQSFLAEERIKVRDANTTHLIAKETGSKNTLQTQTGMTLGSRVENTVQRKLTTFNEQAMIHGGDVDQPWKLSMELMSKSRTPVYDSEDLLQTLKPTVRKKQDIVIVASLVDKIPNLAGLARTCEVFQAKQLVISDLHILKTHQFTSISVTAEDLVEIEEVKPVALRPWLLHRQSEGYQLLGLEQTSTSKILGKFQFPDKCVLVLGREKEGIPADLLQLMNHTIEISQLGLVRSLNVHVSGAIALFEYTKQRTF
eukprot:g3118.t1